VNLEVHIRNSLEAQFREQATAAGENLESFVDKAVESTLAHAASPTSIRRPRRDQWFAEQKKHAECHPRVNHFVDDSRETIYYDGD
jgi:hypothetical protein